MLIERWLASDHAFTTLDLLKAWKALFYCAPLSFLLVLTLITSRLISSEPCFSLD